MIIKLPANLTQRTRRLPQALMLLFAFVMAGTFAFLMAKNPDTTSAADLSGFRPGNIISDYVMSNYNSMSEGDIQNFLKSKNSCNDTDWNKYQYYSSSYSYHWDNGHFVCMADENFDGESAAHIIRQAAQDYQINPQVLIVLLQKEQSLITDTWPNSRQLDYAVGYGCPDDAAGCRAERAGFRKQIRWAAELFREVLNGGWTNYPVGYNYVRYNPEEWCGGSDVYIENLATSSLYRYTPYQPNAEALAAGYGEAKPCGAYGNRNFYLYFTDWFGSTQVPSPANAAIADCTYYFKSILTTDRFLTSSDGLKNSSWNTGSQRWKITNGGTYYSLMDTTTEKYLTNDNGTLTLTESNSTCNQRWIIGHNADSSYTLYSRCDYRAIDVFSGSPANNNLLWMYTSNGTIAQKWFIISAANYDNLTSVDVPEGIYTISSKSNAGFSMDILNAPSGDGANLQLWPNNYSVAQQFKFTRNSDNTYTIENVMSGKVLDLANANPTNTANIQQYTSNDSCAQHWYVINHYGYYHFASKCNPNMVMETAGGNIRTGNNIQLYEDNGTSAQYWKLEKYEAPTPVEPKGVSTTVPSDTTTTVEELVNGATYVITSAADVTKAIDINNAWTDNGTNIHLYMRWGGTTNQAQQWRLTKLADGYYTLINPNSNKTMDVAGGNPQDRTNVWLYEQNGTCAQKWKITKLSTGAYQLAAACNTNQVLDLSYAQTANGTNIQVYQAWGGITNKAQQWFFNRIF